MLNANLEIKARLRSWEQAQEAARRIATSGPEILRQTDTYFFCQNGRLKLREIAEQGDELIWYDRPDQTDSKRSNYCRLNVERPQDLKKALSAALGVRGVVEKCRKVYFYHNVRIHLDQVVGLGEFLEFEAVLGTVGEAQSHKHLNHLRQHFAIEDNDLLATGYADLTIPTEN